MFKNQIKQTNLLIALFVFALFIQCNDSSPTCRIINPTEDSVIKQDSVITISVDAEDSDGEVIEVKFFIDNVGVGNETSFPFNYNWNTKGATISEHQILARAKDNDGNQCEDIIIINIINGIKEATVSTMEASEITQNEAILSGQIISDGDRDIIERGFYWSRTNLEPTNEDNIEIVTDTTILFHFKLRGLEPSTTYHFRAFATNHAGTSHGDIVSFATLKESSTEIVDGTFVDSRDNTTYKTIQIGKQIWMAENLAYLPTVSPSEEQSYTDPIYYVNEYQGNSTEEAKKTWSYKELGVLYNWKAATNACPSGWHLPSADDWEELAEYISEDNGGYNHADNIWENVGKHLKAKDFWVDFVTGNGLDTYGFNAKASGYRRIYDGGFYFLYENLYWWSSTEQGQSSCYYYALFYDQNYLLKYPEDTMYGFSVRCIKD